MAQNINDPKGLQFDVNCVSRRDVIVAAGATVLMSGPLAGSASAATQAEGYFLVFDQQGPPNEQLDRIFFIPSKWLEVFEVTDVFRRRYPELSSSPTGYQHWKQALTKIRNTGSHARRLKISALYANSADTGTEEAVPGKILLEPIQADLNHTYLAMSMSPASMP
jgi:hypothetical protein